MGSSATDVACLPSSLKDSIPSQFIAEQQQQPGPRPERLVKFAQNTVTQGTPSRDGPLPYQALMQFSMSFGPWVALAQS